MHKRTPQLRPKKTYPYRHQMCTHSFGKPPLRLTHYQIQASVRNVQAFYPLPSLELYFRRFAAHVEG